jgi:phage terminase small subunit
VKTGLTPKQQRFVEEYLIDLNATQAAIRAQYSARTAEWQGPQLLGKPHVAAAISALKTERSERTKIDADWVLKMLAAEKTADLSAIYDDDGSLKPIKEWPMVFRTGLVVGVEAYEEYAGTGADRVAIGMVRKVKLSDRLKHLELIGKHVEVQAFRDKLELTGGGPLTVVINKLG